MSNLQQPQGRELGLALEHEGRETGDVVPVEEEAASPGREVSRHGGETRIHPVEHPARRVLAPVERVPRTVTRVRRLSYK